MVHIDSLLAFRCEGFGDSEGFHESDNADDERGAGETTRHVYGERREFREGDATWDGTDDLDADCFEIEMPGSEDGDDDYDER